MRAFIIQSSIIACLTFLSGHAYAQEEKKLELEKCVRVEGGLVMGGLVLNDNFLYSPGGSFNYTYSIKTSEKVGFGFGGGYQFYQDETFIPFYFDFIGIMRKKRNAGFVNFQTGYAFGINHDFKNYAYYDFNGGIYFGVGLGNRFRVNERFSCYLQAAYRHQFASVTYQAHSMPEYHQQLNYDMLVLSFGVMLEQK